MACFLIVTENDFAMIKSSFVNNVSYLSKTSSGVFVKVVGDTKKETKDIVSEIRRHFPETKSDKQHRHHLIPQQFRPEFEKLGINIDEYAVPVPKRDHIGKEGLHNAEIPYNTYWAYFILAHQGCDPEQTRLDAALCIAQCMSYFNIDFDTTIDFRR